MKKILFTLFMAFSALAGMSQTIGEAFYVYRNDGMINTFFRSEIDSIAYSYYDADSLLYDEIVSQVVYTPDSIYQIPLAVIDSVGFVTPETKYLPNVIRLEGEIRNYILGSDSLTVYFRSDTPNNILPKIGDKLVTTEMSDVFEGGFLGQVESIAQTNDTIILKCNMIGLDEVFECFYYSNSYEHPQATNRRRALSWNGSFSPGPFEFSLSNHLKAWLKPVDCPWKVTPKYDVKISPSFHSKGSIIVHPVKGVVINLDIKQQTAISQDIAITGSVGASHDFTPGAFPITAIVPFVYVYGEFGAFIKTNVKVSMEQNWSQSLSYNIHYEASYLPALAIATSIPKLSINGVNLTSEHSGKCLVEGSVSGGIYGEIGIALLEKHVASTGFRLEGGLKLVGNAMIYDSDTQQSLFTTSFYDKLETSDNHLKAFCSVGLEARLIHAGKAGLNVFSKEWELTKFKLVPDFTNTTLARSSTNHGYLSATTTATGGAVFPCNLGFRLFEENEDNSVRGTKNFSYWSLTDKTETISDEFMASALLKKYAVYPTVDMGLGFEMLAKPSAEVEIGATPITLDCENIGETTATVWGKIEGHELLDETAQFGLGYYEAGSSGSTMYNASSINEDGIFPVEFKALKPKTLYKYFAYLVIDGETYYGDNKEFTTKEEEKREAYYVWNSTDSTTTLYYDGMRQKRYGQSFFNGRCYCPYESVKVIFDSSFSNYYPKEFSFSGHAWNEIKLQTIENIEYLKTDSIIDMGNMFWNCSSLKNLDLSNFNTSNVVNMSGMFKGCSSLTNLDLRSFNTSNVTNMNYMFLGCSSLKNINLSSFSTENVTSMGKNTGSTYGYTGGMFEGCSSLTSLDLSSFNTSNVTDMYCMFRGCSSLENLDLSNFVTSNVQDMMMMFSGCSSLTGLNLSGFDTSNVKNMREMFSGCSSLTSLDLSSFSLIYNFDRLATDVNGVFSDCISLKTIYANNWINFNLSTPHSMFQGCVNLVGGQGTKIGQNLYGYDEKGNPLYYYCSDEAKSAHIDGGKDNPGLFTAK